MSAESILNALEETFRGTHPDLIVAAVRGEPRLMLWPALFALGAWLLVGELLDVRGRPALADLFARQDVDRRLRETIEYELARSLGVTPEPSRTTLDTERSLFPPVLKRMLRPVLADAGGLVRGLLARVAPGLAGGAMLERDLHLVRPGASIGGYFAEKIGAALLWLVIPPALAALGGPRTPPILWIVAAVAGFVLPDIDLRRRVRARRERLLAELPAVLDQLVIATSAGLSLEQALDQTAACSEGSVGDELRRLVAELGLGRWRSLQEALGALDRRNGVPELSLLVGQLQAAHRQGVPVGQVLAAQADALRDRRKAQIIEAGGRATVRMVIPIAVFVLPVLVIVILVPAAVQLLQLRN
jgi:hypothetical protein